MDRLPTHLRKKGISQHSDTNLDPGRLTIRPSSEEGPIIPTSPSDLFGNFGWEESDFHTDPNSPGETIRGTEIRNPNSPSFASDTATSAPTSRHVPKVRKEDPTLPLEIKTTVSEGNVIFGSLQWNGVPKTVRNPNETNPTRYLVFRQPGAGETKLPRVENYAWVAASDKVRLTRSEVDILLPQIFLQPGDEIEEAYLHRDHVVVFSVKPDNGIPGDITIYWNAHTSDVRIGNQPVRNELETNTALFRQETLDGELNRSDNPIPLAITLDPFKVRNFDRSDWIGNLGVRPNNVRSLFDPTDSSALLAPDPLLTNGESSSEPPIDIDEEKGRFLLERQRKNKLWGDFNSGEPNLGGSNEVLNASIRVDPALPPQLQSIVTGGNVTFGSTDWTGEPHHVSNLKSGAIRSLVFKQPGPKDNISLPTVKDYAGVSSSDVANLSPQEIEVLRPEAFIAATDIISQAQLHRNHVVRYLVEPRGGGKNKHEILWNAHTSEVKINGTVVKSLEDANRILDPK